MTSREKLNELISAALDGELPSEDEGRLASWLADNPDADRLTSDFSELQQMLGDVEPVAPPPDVRNAILTQLRGRQDEGSLFDRVANLFSGLFGMQYMLYAGSFVAGAVLVMAVAGTDNVSWVGAGSTSRLVGTIGAVDAEAQITHGTVTVDESDVRAAITLTSRDTLVVIDIEFDSGTAADLVTTFDAAELRFRGIEQPPGTPASLASVPGQVTLRLSDKGRYTVYMEIAATSPASIGLGIDSAGKTIHKVELEIND